MARIDETHPERGMALIELALVLVFLVVLTFGVMEYGWMFFKIQQVTNAARGGARHAVLPDATNPEVQQIVDSLMLGWGMDAAGYAVIISTADVASLTPGEIVTVTVEVPYDSVELLGMSIFPTPVNLRASASMAKEGP